MSVHALIPIGIVGGVLAILAKESRSRKKGTGRVSNPFSDAGCTTLRSREDARRWIDTVGFRRYQEAYASDPVTAADPQATQRLKVAGYTAWALAQLPLQCTPYNVIPDRRDLFKQLWCSIASDLAARGRIDEEVEEFLAACTNPSFNPIDHIDPVAGT